MKSVEFIDSLITSPPSLITKGVYSSSKSEIKISSVVLKRYQLFLFEENDFPEPGVPKTNPFGFLRDFRLT